MSRFGKSIYWELVSPLTVEDIQAQRWGILKRLQKVSDDVDLQMLDIQGGLAQPTIVRFEGSPQGYQRIRTLVKTMQLTDLVGVMVKEVRERQHNQHNIAETSQISQIQPRSPGAGWRTVAVDSIDLEELQREIYNHLNDCVQKQDPADVLERFRCLFIDSGEYSDLKIRATLEKIVNAKSAENEYHLFLNHCCYLLIDYWQLDSKQRHAIPELIALFEEIPPPGMRQTRSVRRLRQLAEMFVETHQYKMLQRLARVICPVKDSEDPNRQLVKVLLYRYTYLFRHYLLDEESTYEQQQTIKLIQSRLQNRFEFRLNRFVTYQVTLAEIAKARQLSQGAGRILRREKNPTFLSDRELAIALRLFFGKVQGNYTYQQLAERFSSHIPEISSYQEFKDKLLAYLVSNLDSDFALHQLNPQLKKCLNETLTHYNHQKMSNSLILRTSTKLLSFLVVENAQNVHHYLFIDLVTHLGAASTLGLLLKIVLLCPPVLGELEKRFAILFNHYEEFPQSDVVWFIKVLETFRVAHSIQFGTADLSPLYKLVKR
ncbi:hypothetical protein [Spirulina subsalsa]|uniref:hypothetical protein n=1 Tax=Spirulina subsalsa TaxID=54311 RepID=UPI00031DB3A4|nr:hypothetical protein [Spirulina subsalsa]